MLIHVFFPDDTWDHFRHKETPSNPHGYRPSANRCTSLWVGDGGRVEGDKLVADFGDIEPAFADLVRAKRYRKISASFWSPHAASHPAPEAYTLKHVGFLGASAPAVTGLKDAEFNASVEGVVEFGDDKEQMLDFVCAIDDGQFVSFSNGAGTVGYALVSTGVALGVTALGNLLIKALIPPSSDDSTNSSYSISSTKNQMVPDGAVPVVLGTYHFAPPYAARPYTEIVDDKQFMRAQSQRPMAAARLRIMPPATRLNCRRAASV
jgi:hypothetical protein